MSIKKFEEYNKLNEFQNQQMTDQELFEMSNFWGSDLGLDENIVIWIGSVLSTQHNGGNRIKVSNIPGKGPGKGRSTFSILIPSLETDGKVNTKHITTKKLNKIREFIKLNMDLIIAYCQEEISSKQFSDRYIKYGANLQFEKDDDVKDDKDVVNKKQDNTK